MSIFNKEDRLLSQINRKIARLTARENRKLRREAKLKEKQKINESKKNKKKKIEPKCKTPWYSSYSENVPKHLDYPDCSLYDQLVETKNKYPDNISYNYFGTKVTYKQFIKQIDEAARAFKNIGVNKGEKVSICMPNTPEAIISFYALNKIGVIANMIHPLSSENEIKKYLEVSESVAIVTIDVAATKIAKIIDSTKVRCTIVVSPNNSMPRALGIGYFLTRGRKIKVKKNKRTVLSWKQFIDGEKNITGDINEHTDSSYPAAILYSGGTSGTPKGILHSNLAFNAMAISGVCVCGTLKPDDSILAIMPVFHGFGLAIGIHTFQVLGGTSILIPQFSAKEFDKYLSKYKPNVIAGVPTLFEAMLTNKRMEKLDLSYLKILFSGGDSLSPALKEKVDKFLHEHGATIEVREGYGLTESLAGTCLTPATMYKENSMGIPYPDMYYKIVEPNTHTEVEYGEIGEICISGPCVMIGYLNEPKETALALQLHEDGMVWLHTGDLGCMDKQGWIYYKQRLKRLIISSGYNIYPQYVESVIDSHPDVLMSTVIGIPHPYKVQVAKAYIVLNEGVKASDKVKESIKEHCIKNIAKYSLPYEYEFRDSLPRTLVGKVAYKELEKEEKEKEC